MDAPVQLQPIFHLVLLFPIQSCEVACSPYLQGCPDRLMPMLVRGEPSLVFRKPLDGVIRDRGGDRPKRVVELKVLVIVRQGPGLLTCRVIERKCRDG